ncbi:HEAT repeat domain-containing protein [Neobacillus thermocopriae]|uniref:HEAT repeat domain-containing protein n=1 Tax=Neobacillus thermocopriae TaxID=1215031 RepID=UPI0037700EFE
MDEEQLLDLIKEMSDSERELLSEESLSFQAYRKAKKLKDINHIPFLHYLLEKTKEIDTRNNIYFILSKIGANTGDKRVLDILFKGLETEKNNYLLMRILEGIAEQRKVEDCTPIIKLINDKRHLVRHSAMKAIRACKSCLAEEAIIKIISHATDENDLRYACSVLCEIGTNKSIPYLINLLQHTKGNTKCSVLWALSELGDHSLLPIFLNALEDRSSSV